MVAGRRSADLPWSHFGVPVAWPLFIRAQSTPCPFLHPCFHMWALNHLIRLWAKRLTIDLRHSTIEPAAVPTFFTRNCCKDPCMWGGRSDSLQKSLLSLKKLNSTIAISIIARESVFSSAQHYYEPFFLKLLESRG